MKERTAIKETTALVHRIRELHPEIAMADAISLATLIQQSEAWADAVVILGDIADALNDMRLQRMSSNAIH